VSPVILHTEYRYILRSRAGETLRHPDGRVLEYPSYMSALRGRAMTDTRAHIIQQERDVYRETLETIHGIF
jgi:hypothetical protein